MEINVSCYQFPLKQSPSGLLILKKTITRKFLQRISRVLFLFILLHLLFILRNNNFILVTQQPTEPKSLLMFADHIEIVQKERSILPYSACV